MASFTTVKMCEAMVHSTGSLNNTRPLLRFLSLLIVQNEQFTMFCNYIGITVRPRILLLTVGVTYILLTMVMLHMLCYKPILCYTWMNCRSSSFLHQTETYPLQPFCAPFDNWP